MFVSSKIVIKVYVSWNVQDEAVYLFQVNLFIQQ